MVRSTKEELTKYAVILTVPKISVRCPTTWLLFGLAPGVIKTKSQSDCRYFNIGKNTFAELLICRNCVIKNTCVVLRLKLVSYL